MKKTVAAILALLTLALSLASCGPAVPYYSDAMSAPDPSGALAPVPEPVAVGYGDARDLPDSAYSYLYGLLTPTQRVHYDALSRLLFKLLNNGGGEDIVIHSGASGADAERASQAFAWDYGSFGELITTHLKNVEDTSSGVVTDVAYRTSDDAARSVGEAQRVLAAADSVIALAPAEKGDVERLRVFAEWIIDHVEYPRDYFKRDGADSRLWDARGALLDGEAVCAGYAAAFDLILRRAGYLTVRVSGTANGTGHAWNLVLLDGGWYHVDATWMEDHYDVNFLVDDATMRSGDHSEWWIIDTSSGFAPPAADTLALCPAYFTDAASAVEYARAQISRRVRTVRPVFTDAAARQAFADTKGSLVTAADGVTYYLRVYDYGDSAAVEAYAPAAPAARTVNVPPRKVETDFDTHAEPTDAYCEIGVLAPASWVVGTEGDYACIFDAYGEYYPVFELMQTVYSPGGDLEALAAPEVNKNASGDSFGGLARGFYSSAAVSYGATDAGGQYMLFSKTEGAGSFRGVAFVDLGGGFFCQIGLRDPFGSGETATAALKSVCAIVG